MRQEKKNQRMSPPTRKELAAKLGKAATKAQEQEKEIKALKQQLAAATAAAPARQLSSQSTTPPGRGTPAHRNPAMRPSASSREAEGAEQKDEEAEGDDEEEEDSDDEGGANGDDGAGDGDGQESDDEYDKDVMRQLLEGFRSQRVSPEDRESLMHAAGEQFSNLLATHWKDKSEPPDWLVSLFRPAPASTVAPASAAVVNQVNHSPTASTSSTVGRENNAGSSSPGLIFHAPDLPAESRNSSVHPRNLAHEFATSRRTHNNTDRPSNPDTQQSTPPLANSSVSSVDGTPSSYTPHGSTPKFTFRQNDLPKELVFSGKPGDQDVVEVLTRYRARVKLTSVAADNPPESVVDQRAIQFLPFVLRDAAYESLIQLTQGSLEWRSENRLTALRNAGHSVRPRAPANWEEYCHAFAFIFSAPNRISVLAREIATIKQSEDQTVDSYSLQVTQARTRLLAEAARSAPAHLSPHEHAWDVFMTATFENGLLPGIRLESIREDPPNTFQEARIRAKKHEANNLRGAASSTPTTVSAVTRPAPPQLTNKVNSHAATIKSLQEELSTLKDEMKQYESRASSNTHGNSKRARTSDKGASNSAPKKRNEKCPYPGCKYFHPLESCKLKKNDAARGFTRVDK